MLVPHLHFNGNCAEAIALYEKAFSTKAGDYDYGRDHKIAHANMIIHGQMIWLNDAKEYIKNEYGINCAAHFVLTFNTSDELLACYENFKTDDTTPLPFYETPYSKLSGNFLDKFGVLWGFMVEAKE